MPEVRLAVVVLVDARGWVLLQERDEAAPRAPGKWGFVGGHVEPDETFEEAAYRELAEETGIELHLGHLYLWREHEMPYDEQRTGRYHVYVARVDLTDADVVLGEGAQIVFVDPAQVPTLPLSTATTVLLPAFLSSAMYARLTGAGAPRRFASVLLVDPGGRVLLQERDEHPVLDPECWGFVGGAVEPGESEEAAAHRELEEETGVRLGTGLARVGTYDVFHESTGSWDVFTLWTAATTVTDDDVVVGEGRRIVFLRPEDTADLPLTASARVALAPFLASEQYRALVEGKHRAAP